MAFILFYTFRRKGITDKYIVSVFLSTPTGEMMRQQQSLSLAFSREDSFCRLSETVQSAEGRNKCRRRVQTYIHTKL